MVVLMTAATGIVLGFYAGIVVAHVVSPLVHPYGGSAIDIGTMGRGLRI